MRCPDCGTIVMIDGQPEDLTTEFQCTGCAEVYSDFEEAEKCCTSLEH